MSPYANAATSRETRVTHKPLVKVQAAAGVEPQIDIDQFGFVRLS